MRDIALTLVMAVLLPMILIRGPYFGVLVWTWLSFMNPHRLTWSFAFNMPFAMMTALLTLIALLSSREPKQIIWTRETILLLVFIGWTLITTTVAIHQDAAWEMMNKWAKIQVMTYVTLMVMQSRERINMLISVMALSLAFYGVKGGIFTINTGGGFHVRGPEYTFIAGDNNLGLALCMTIPLLRYMQLQTKRIWAKNALTATMALCAIGAAGTQSRGALLGLGAMGAFLWLKSRNRFATMIMAIAAVVLIMSFMPQQWFDRMNSIQNYEQDASSLGRINAWHMAFAMAKDRPLGGGFDSFTAYEFMMYAPDPDNVHDSHSIFFQVMGHHGFVGLGLYLLLMFWTWRTAGWVIKRAKRAEETRWAADLCAMVQVSLVAFAVAGAFLGVAYFDFYYALIVVVVLTKHVLVTSAQKVQPAREESRRGVALPATVTANR